MKTITLTIDDTRCICISNGRGYRCPMLLIERSSGQQRGLEAYCAYAGYEYLGQVKTNETGEIDFTNFKHGEYCQSKAKWSTRKKK